MLRRLMSLSQCTESLKQSSEFVSSHCHFIVHVQYRRPELYGLFNNKRSATKFTYEEELDNKLHYVSLNRKEIGSIGRSMYRKSSSESQFTQFLGFVLIHYKRNLVECLANRVGKICLGDIMNKELELIHNMLVDMSYHKVSRRNTCIQQTRKQRHQRLIRKPSS